MVYRVYVERKNGFENDANALFYELKNLLGIKGLKKVRLINRYDAENIEKSLFDYSITTVFSEPQSDNVLDKLPTDADAIFAVEYLPGQFDQRADSASQCLQLIAQCERPLIRTAKVYALYGDITTADVDAVKKYVVNPVESRLASLEEYETLKQNYEIPTAIKTIDGFITAKREDLAKLGNDLGLAMDTDDLVFCQQYFITEKRNPTLTEIRMIDTYWSDHCRHTTFLTTLDKVEFEDELLKDAFNDYLAVRKELNRTKPINLMDIATIAVRYLKKHGKLDKLDESEEINACTVKIKVDNLTSGEKEDWLLLFKNETHNHPTEIEPFGGAATCIGGAIRDPLSGRSYVYGAMRVTGAGNPLTPVEDTIKGKLPQRKIVTTAASGYSSYGNQIGLATGIVDELYHDGYVAKRMEIGAVIAGAPAKNVRRETPLAGDIIILLGGRTGRDGCGGATGSSKSHTLESLESCGAEVQKGNAPEERKLQRLFRNEEATRLIKRCNDFGAGGVSVAIGELADGLEINLNAVPKKYDGLDGTELAISESQERMAVVVEAKDVDKFIELAGKENLEATVVAVVTDKNRLVMRWNDAVIVDISRDFLNSNGAEKHTDAITLKPENYDKKIGENFVEELKNLAGDLNVCSKKGLSERFDSTIGAGTVLMPFGGKYQMTPIQAMVNKISMEKAHTDDCSFMAWGYNPFITEKSPYHGAYLAVVESVSKLIATGADFNDVYLTFQEYFEKPKKEAKRWGKPLSALLGAFKAQMDLGIGSIGGKDSMSGSFENIDVPPTLVSFAVTTDKVQFVKSPEFKKAGNKVVLLKPEYDKNGLPISESLIALYGKVNSLLKGGVAVSAYTPCYGGVIEGVMKMAFGNGFGFKFADVCMDELFSYNYGSFILELNGSAKVDQAIELGEVTVDANFVYKTESISVKEVQAIYENKLEPIYPMNAKPATGDLSKIEFKSNKIFTSNIKVAKPKVLIPVFPGTNCELDTAKAFADAGADPEVFVIKNLTSSDVSKSVEEFAKKIKSANVVFVPGGFSGGDEPDGSGKFITAFFRNPAIKENVHELLNKNDGLMGGICNGFQALIKLGLVPYGKIVDMDENCATLTYNNIGRHQSKIVRVRVCTDNSPWLAGVKVGDVFNVPISHGEGKFVANDALLKQLIANGQVMTQYVDLDGNPSADIAFNPNGSVCAIEGILSPDGRVFGKMGHSERKDGGLYANVLGEYDMKLFESAVKYFKK